MRDRQGRVVVLGASGMLGRALTAELRSRGREVAAPPRNELDLLAPGDLTGALAAFAPSAVVNAAAYTDVRRAELPEERDRVYRLNRDVPGNLAVACRDLGVTLLHLSTDYVFDGRKHEPYREEDPVAPLQVYGRSKLEGDRAVLGAHEQALVVRTSTLYGPGARERPHYVDAILRQAREQRTLDVVRLPISSPTYAPDLAWGLVELLSAGATGLVHLVNAGGCSRLALARETVRRAGLAQTVEVRERPEPPDGLQRPAYSILDTSRFSEWTGRSMRGWSEALGQYVAEWAR